MKAVICTKYGPPEVLKIQEMPKPKPGPKDVLVKIHATTVHVGDTKLRALRPGMGKLQDFFFKPMMRLMIGLTGPRKKILGMELAGEVEFVGAAVSNFKAGDRVFAATEMSFGGYAEYACLSEDSVLVTLPDGMSYEEAAPIPNGGITALRVLKKADIKKGQSILIYGASGSLGTFAIQLAKHSGAIVTGVCSTTNLDLVRDIGADQVIDYTKEDFTKSGEAYDLVFDTIGITTKAQCQDLLKPTGVYMNILKSSGGLKLFVEELEELRDLMENGVLTSVIDKVYPLDEIVEAHRYVDRGHKKGNVVIQVASAN